MFLTLLSSFYGLRRINGSKSSTTNTHNRYDKSSSSAARKNILILNSLLMTTVVSHFLIVMGEILLQQHHQRQFFFDVLTKYIAPFLILTRFSLYSFFTELTLRLLRQATKMTNNSKGLWLYRVSMKLMLICIVAVCTAVPSLLYSSTQYAATASVLVGSVSICIAFFLYIHCSSVLCDVEISRRR